MKLKTLEITNFRCFESLSMDFDEQLTVLVAKNGAGKTAILDAISVAFGVFIGGFDKGKGKGFESNDARLVRRESQYPITLNASGMINNEEFEHWSRELTGEKNNTTFGNARNLIHHAKTLQSQVRSHQQIDLPIIAYYGTGRLWKDNRAEQKKGELGSRLYGYHEALNPDSNYKTFKQWFINKSLADGINKTKKLLPQEPLLQKPKRDELFEDYITEIKYNSNGLKCIQKAITQCLSVTDYSTLEYDYNWENLVLIGENEIIMPISQLSDGVKAMLGLTADIAYRCVKLNPHLESPPEETSGIVMIDEIELHLHPAWQQTVLNDLCKAFPKIQFIVTTHSPQVISTVASRQIRILDDDKVYQAEAGTQGAEASRILKRIFGVDPRPQNDPNTKLLNEYLDLVYSDKWNESEAKEKRAKLDVIYQSNEPALTAADLYIENRQWELESEENQ